MLNVGQVNKMTDFEHYMKAQANKDKKEGK